MHDLSAIVVPYLHVVRQLHACIYEALLEWLWLKAEVASRYSHYRHHVVEGVGRGEGWMDG